MTVRALEFYRSPAKYVGARALGARAPGLVSGPLAPLRLVSLKDQAPPRPGWARVRPRLSGICGSDLATISGRSSFYFSPLVSLPFVPGHEVVGELLDDCEDLAAGTRIVMSSVLACAARGEDPVCPNCAAGDTGRCDRVTVGHLQAGPADRASARTPTADGGERCSCTAPSCSPFPTTCPTRSPC